MARSVAKNKEEFKELPMIKLTLKEVKTRLGPDCSSSVAKAIISNNAYDKIKEVKKALENIRNNLGDNAFYPFYALRNENLADLFVNDPEEISGAFIEIAKAAKDHVSNVFFPNGEDELIKLFAKGLGQVTKAFVQLAQIFGDHNYAPSNPFYALTNPDVFDFFSKSMDTHAETEKAKKFAEETGIGKIDGEMRVNIVWALGTIGKEKAAVLYKSLGITYFMRYSTQTLNTLYENVTSGQSDKPVALAVFNAFDDNGAFYRAGRELEQLAKYYKLLVVEVSDDQQFYDRIKQMGGDHGPIHVLLIAGHGSPDSITFGIKFLGEEVMLDLTDQEEIRKRNLNLVLAPKSKIVLISCSTGQNEKSIGARLSKTFGADAVYAPQQASSETYYNLDKDGMILDVTFDVSGSSFRKGKLRTLPKRVK